MIRPRNALPVLALGVALASFPVVAASAAQPPGYDARAQAPAVGGEISLHRAQTLRQCSNANAKTLNYVWGDMQSDQLRACMAQHGEVE